MKAFHSPPRSSIRNICRRLPFRLLALALVAILSACEPNLSVLPQPTASGSPHSMDTPAPTPLPPQVQAEILFRVETPANTPPDSKIYLTILDQVTGLALNARSYPMKPASDSQEGTTLEYSLALPFPVGAAIEYRYERQVGSVTVAEHISDGRPVLYRLYHVEGPGSVDDVISRWTDTPFNAPTGRINGTAVDAQSGKPIPGLLVTAGGQQTFTASDGSFVFEGLPVGVHNLVALSPDGTYRTFQQGARVAAESTTPAPLKLVAAKKVKVTFLVTVPKGTPPVIPVRLAGSLYQTGNIFANLSGGMSSLASAMPALTALPDGCYRLVLELPSGAGLSYKYTLGDGFWNAEHTKKGDFRLRQITIPETDVQVEDEIDTWESGKNGAVTFDLHVPAGTPPNDTVWIQFKTLLGWNEPFPLWSLGNGRWAYILYSPLNLPGDVSYRYCRDAQCGRADDVSTAGEQAAGRPLKVSTKPQTLTDQVQAWVDWNPDVQLTSPPAGQVNPRPKDFLAGVELASQDISFQGSIASTLEEIRNYEANWLIFTPSWTFTRLNPLTLEPVSGQDPLWLDTLASVQQAQAQGFLTSLYPTPRFPQSADTWWTQAPRDYGWWLAWFDRLRTFYVNYADMAQLTKSQSIILGGDWLAPALPNGTLPDGSSSNVPTDAESRWRSVIAEVRNHYSGQLLWALPAGSIDNPPAFLDAVDGIYLLWPPIVNGQIAIPPQDDGSESARVLDGGIHPVQVLYNKALYLGVDLPSTSDLQAQARSYDVLFNLINARDWVDGVASRGYFPTPLQDPSPSVNGKPAGEVMRYWFKGWLGR